MCFLKSACYAIWPSNVRFGITEGNLKIISKSISNGERNKLCNYAKYQSMYLKCVLQQTMRKFKFCSTQYLGILHLHYKTPSDVIFVKLEIVKMRLTLFYTI